MRTSFPGRTASSWFQLGRRVNSVSDLRFAFVLAAAFVSLTAARCAASSPVRRTIRADENYLRTTHFGLPLTRRLAAAPQDSPPSGPPADSGNIRWAERFPGNDLGAQINAADADLGKEAGEIEVSRPGTVESKVSLSSNHVLHLLAPTTWKAGIVVQNGNSVVGEGCASSITLAFPTPGPFIYGKGISNLKVSNLCAQAPPRSAGYTLATANGREVEVTGCQTSNVRLAELDSASDVKIIGNTAISDRVDEPSGPAVAITFTQGAVASNNIIRGFRNGFEWWGGDADPKHGQGAVTTPRGARNLSFIGNTVTDVGAGAIWGGMGEGIVANRQYHRAVR